MKIKYDLLSWFGNSIHYTRVSKEECYIALFGVTLILKADGTYILES